MAGRLIYVMGSSGAGKDTLLRAIMSRRLSQRLVLAQRHITRPVTTDENHHRVTQAEFDANVANDVYAMHWRANGYCYGIEKSILTDLEQGRQVLLNGSRAYLPVAQEKFPDLLGVCLVVDSATLRHRLVTRGRDSAQDIEARLQRNASYQAGLPDNILHIKNNGCIEDTCQTLLQQLSIESMA